MNFSQQTARHFLVATFLTLSAIALASCGGGGGGGGTPAAPSPEMQITPVPLSTAIAEIAPRVAPANGEVRGQIVASQGIIYDIGTFAAGNRGELLDLSTEIAINARVFHQNGEEVTTTALSGDRRGRMFIAPSTGLYYVYISVADSAGATAQRETSASDLTVTTSHITGEYVCVFTRFEDSTSDDSLSLAWPADPYPDLQVLDSVVQTGGGEFMNTISVAAGEEFTMQLRVVNRGPVESPPVTLHYLRSTDSNITHTDTAAHEDNTDTVPRLPTVQIRGDAINFFYRGTITLNAPTSSTYPQTYYYGGCVTRHFSESNRNNNCSPAVTVVVGQADSTPSFATTVDDQAYTLNVPIAALNLPAASGGDGALTYTLSPLPSGLSFNDSTRMLSGTPDTVTALNLTYTATDSDATDADSAALTFAVTVVGGITLPAVTDWGYERGTPIRALTLPAATGGASPLVYTLGTTIPPGLSFNSDPDTRTLTGTPTTDGVYPLTYAVRDSNGLMTMQTFTIRVRQAPSGGETGRPHPPLAQCNSQVLFDSAGFVALPSIDRVTIPADAGRLNLRWDSYNIPDRFVVNVGGRTLIDSQYVGDSSYSIGEINRVLSTAGLPQTSQSSVISPGQGSRTASKTGAETQAVVEVYAPLSGTAWDITLTWLCGDPPDLVVETPTVDNANPTSSAITFRATVRNQGRGDAPVTAITYYRSTDAAIVPADDVEVGDDSISALAANASSALSESLSVPFRIGTYYYGACAGNVIGESNTGNNCSTGVRVDVNTLPAQSLPSGGQVDGEIAVANEVDVYRFQATSGDSIVAYTTAPPGVANVLTDSVGQLHDRNGVRLARNDDGDTDDGLNFRIEHTATYTGTYYIQVSGLGSRTGRYRLRVEISD